MSSLCLHSCKDPLDFDVSETTDDGESLGYLDNTGSETSEQRSSSEADFWHESVDACFDWVFEKILCMKHWNDETFLLVQWQGGDLSWETEDALIDWGLASKLKYFKESQARRRKGGARRRIPRRETETPEQRCLRDAKENDRRLKSAQYSDPSCFFPNFARCLEERFASVGHEVMEVENICRQDRAVAFAALLGGQQADMLFHGTSAFNLASIIEHGLRIPGSHGVTVANGSAYGVGIYTASTPQLGYARDFQHLSGEVQFICCAGLRGGSEVRETGAYTVFFAEVLVLPCYLVTVRRRRPNVSPMLSLTPRSLRSELPVKVELSKATPLIAYPCAGRIERLGQPVLPTSRRTVSCVVPVQARRVLCIIRGDHEAGMDGRTPVWYSRARKTLTGRGLRRMPRLAKLASREGLLQTAKQDRSRALHKRQRQLAVMHARQWKIDNELSVFCDLDVDIEVP